MTVAEEIKKAAEARDYLTMVEVGYKAFGAGDVEALKEYFTMVRTPAPPLLFGHPPRQPRLRISLSPRLLQPYTKPLTVLCRA